MKFKVGDRVKSEKLGEGEVTYVSKYSDGDFDVAFDNELKVMSFYKDGLSLFNDNKVTKIKEKIVKFKVGDIVEFGGIEGILRESSNLDYTLTFYPNNPSQYSEKFTIEGKLDILHTKPMLNLIHRPAQKLELSSECVKIAVLKHIAMFEGDLEAILEELGFDIDYDLW